MTLPWYCTREEVKAALDFKETARNNAQVDRAIESASRSAEALLHRTFYPWTGTRYFDWPNGQYARSWRLWLEEDEVLTVTSLVSGGVTIAPADYYLGPWNTGPPYNAVEINIGDDAAFSAGDTHQKSIAIAGTFGGSATEAPAGLLAEALDDTETGVDITDSGVIGVGDLIRVDSERFVVTGKSMLDTAVDIHASDSLTASAADVSILCSTATGIPQSGEVILIDSERMLVVDLAGTTLTVKRAWDGSVLATHAAAASIYAPRTLTVARASAGTSAASHLTAAPIYRNVPPGPVRAMCVADALCTVLNESAGYARTAGSGENAREAAGRALADARKQAYRAYGRKMRMGAV
jgi:hypothetical protein